MGMTWSRLSSSSHSITTIGFLTRLGKIGTPISQQSIVLSDVLVFLPSSTRSITPQPESRWTEASWGHSSRKTYQTTGSIQRLHHPLRLYFRLSCAITSTAPLGESIASEGNNREYIMTCVEGRMPTSRGEPILSAVIET